MHAPLPLGLSETDPEHLKIGLPAVHESGWVFMNDTWYPGWKAEVDATTVVIEKGLEAFRLVPVGANARELTFQYKPLSVWLGLAVSLLTLLGLGFAIRLRLN